MEGYRKYPMLAFLKAMRCWPWAVRLGVLSGVLLLAYVFQIPLENEVPGEPFLLFFLAVSVGALAFGQGVGLGGVALSTLLSFFFFEPHNTVTLLHASDLVQIELYALLAAGGVVALARIADALIAADEAARRLEVSERAHSVLLRELAHRVANNFAAVAALIRRKANAVGDAAARSVLNEAVDQVMVLARLHSRLRAESAEACLDSAVFIQELCGDLRASIGRGRPLVLQCAAVSCRLSVAEAIPLGLIVNELVTNAVKYAFPDGRPGTVRVSLEEAQGRLCLSVEDDGVGLEACRSRGTGLGLELVGALAQQLGGRLEIDRASRGGRFLVIFPSARAIPDLRPSPSSLPVMH